MTRPADNLPSLTQSQLSQSQFEVIRDFLVVMSRRMTKAQVLEISDDLHLVLRRRETRTWDEARLGTSGFEQGCQSRRGFTAFPCVGELG